MTFIIWRLLSLLPLAHCLGMTLAFLLFWEQVKFASASGLLHLHWLFFLPGVLFFWISESAPTHPLNHSFSIVCLKGFLRLLNLNLKWSPTVYSILFPWDHLSHSVIILSFLFISVCPSPPLYCKLYKNKAFVFMFTIVYFCLTQCCVTYLSSSINIYWIGVNSFIQADVFQGSK